MCLSLTVFTAILFSIPTGNAQIGLGNSLRQSGAGSSYNNVSHEAVDGNTNFEDQVPTRFYDSLNMTHRERRILNDEPTDTCKVGHEFSDGSKMSIPPTRNSCACFYDTVFTDNDLEKEWNVDYAPIFNKNPDPKPLITPNSKLLMDIWKPPYEMMGPLRPAIVLVHGGNCKTGSKKNFTKLAMEFSKRGWVAVSIDYRLLSKDASCRTSGSIEAAGSDAKAAIRYMEANSDRLNIDPDRIAILGYSAGGRTSMYASFVEGNGVNKRPGSKYNNSQDYATYPGKTSACVEISADFFAPNEDVPPNFENHKPPLMIVAGEKDSNPWTRCSVAENNYKLALGAKIYAEKYVSSNAGHNVLRDDGDAIDLIYNFLFKALSLGSIDCQCPPFISFEGKNKVCRGDHSKDNLTSYYTVHSVSPHDVDKCTALCQNSSCYGVEYNQSNGRCEVWKRLPLSTGKVNRFECYVKEDQISHCSSIGKKKKCRRTKGCSWDGDKCVTSTSGIN